MAKLRSVNTHFWDDSFVINLDPIEKLLFLYFLTNPLANISGAYEITLRRVAFDTGIDSDMILKILARFEAADKMVYRDGWILITNFIKNQSLNPKITAGIKIAIKCCPDWIKHRLSIDYPSLSIDYDNLNSNSNLNSNPNSNGASDTPSAAEGNPVDAEAAAEVEIYLSEVRGVYKSNILSQESRWLETIEKAISAKISSAEFIAALRNLLGDKTRKYPVTPENVLTAAIEQRARQTDTPQIPNISDPPKYPSRNAEMEARGFPKMKVISEASH